MARKIENAFTDLKRRMKRRKRVYPLKTCLPSRNPLCPSEKCENVFIDEKRDPERRKLFTERNESNKGEKAFPE